MNAGEVQKILKKIMEIDKRAEAEKERIALQMQEAEERSQMLAEEVKRESKRLQEEHGNEVYQSILEDARKREAELHLACEKKMAQMEKLVDEEKSTMLDDAVSKLQLNERGLQ